MRQILTDFRKSKEGDDPLRPRIKQSLMRSSPSRALDTQRSRDAILDVLRKKESILNLEGLNLTMKDSLAQLSNKVDRRNIGNLLGSDVLMTFNDKLQET